MSLYLDASILVPLFVAESKSLYARSALEDEMLIVSDFAAAEFSSGLGRRYRERSMTHDKIFDVFYKFDTWMDRGTSKVTTQTEDIRSALQLVRRLELGLRTPDALHIALARRLNAKLFTLDEKLAAAARLVGLETLS